MSTSPSRSEVLERWSLRGRNYVVTGGSKGIGLAIVQALLAHDAAKVLFCSREKEDKMESLIADLQAKYGGGGDSSSSVLYVSCDLGTPEGRQALFEAAKEKLIRVHGLVNNVGVNIRKSILDQTEEEYYKIIRTNVDSAYFVSKLFYELLLDEKDNDQTEEKICDDNSAKTTAQGGSTIVNVSSVAGVQSSGTGIAYAMSKAALNQLTRGLACEWAHCNIRVNAVTPWVTWTPMLEEAMKQTPPPVPSTEGDAAAPVAKPLQKELEWTPNHRLGRPEDVAGPVVFLCLPAASHITGQVLAVDGGLTAQAFSGPCTNLSPAT